ncbi:unnamed protein product [Mytilus coruscus]|uniref:Uncharacterized protein n=1 Tax=Mytilus coruscus TaxID=42192 RepID=A0A6J8E945_MYTCO|nr:unnamed protein product [Mytilus coruscus]
MPETQQRPTYSYTNTTMPEIQQCPNYSYTSTTMPEIQQRPNYSYTSITMPEIQQRPNFSYTSTTMPEIRQRPNYSYTSTTMPEIQQRPNYLQYQNNSTISNWLPRQQYSGTQQQHSGLQNFENSKQDNGRRTRVPFYNGRDPWNAYMQFELIAKINRWDIDTKAINEAKNDVEIRKVGGKRYITEERLTQFERGMKIPSPLRVETVGQVTAHERLEKFINTVEMKNKMTIDYMYDDDEFVILNQDLSLNLLFEETEEVQKSAPCEVSGCAKPSHEIEENISIDRGTAATITVPLVNNEVKAESVIGTGVGVTLLKEGLYLKKLNTIPVNAEIVIAGEGENGEGKIDILPDHENKGEIKIDIRRCGQSTVFNIKIPESLVLSSEIVQISNVVNDGIQTNRAKIQMMPEILEDRYIHVIHVRNSKNLANEVKSRQLLLIDKDEIVAPKTELDQMLRGELENTEHITKDILRDWRKKKKRAEEDTRRMDIMKDLRKKK